MPSPSKRRSYKEVRLQQLRSFCATARLGSLTAAAAALEVSQPTVWEQVHALEQEFEVQLIEPHGRGTRLTEMGRYLAEIADPLVSSIDSLKRRLHERRVDVETRLTVAAPQRVLVEDLPEAVSIFRSERPRVRLRLLERRTGQVEAAVEAGEADIGIDSPGGSEISPRLQSEQAYELDELLVTPRGHPLSQKKRISLRDLSRYPIVNASEDFIRPELAERLHSLGVFDGPQRQVEAVSTAVIRRYVELGFGIGLVLGRLHREWNPRLFECSMSRYFGRGVFQFVWRRGLPLSGPARDFADTIRRVLA